MNETMRQIIFMPEKISPYALSLVSHCPCLAGCDSPGLVRLHTPAKRPSDDCAPPPVLDEVGGTGSLSVHPEHRRKAFKHSFLLLLNALIMLMPDANKNINIYVHKNWTKLQKPF